MMDWRSELDIFVSVWAMLAQTGRVDEVGSMEFRRVLAQYAAEAPILATPLDRWIVQVANQDCYGKEAHDAAPHS